MKLRNIPGPTVLDYPSHQAVRVVGASGYKTGHDSYDDNSPGGYQWPRVKAKGLGDEETGDGGEGKASYGYSRRIRLDENT